MHLCCSFPFQTLTRSHSTNPLPMTQRAFLSWLSFCLFNAVSSGDEEGALLHSFHLQHLWTSSVQYHHPQGSSRVQSTNLTTLLHLNLPMPPISPKPLNLVKETRAIPGPEFLCPNCSYPGAFLGNIAFARISDRQLAAFSVYRLQPPTTPTSLNTGTLPSI